MTEPSSPILDAPETNSSDTITLSIFHHGKPMELTFSSPATISDLSSHVEAKLSIPPSNQKFIISKIGLLKPPFKDPSLSLSSLQGKKITLMGSTTFEVKTLNHTAAQAASTPSVPRAKIPVVKAYKYVDAKKDSEEAQYTFLTLRPLPYLPRPERSLQFLQRLKDDIGIRASMRKHKFTVPLLTEMNPIEHTQSNHEGTSRTLGLNRNAGEVIELRLRTDAYDGYRDYKTIRKTLCHELAHNVHGPHDRNFWELCKQIEREVEAADYRKSGRSLADNEGGVYAGGQDEEDYADDHGGWTGGDFVLGTGSAGGAESTGVVGSSSGGGGTSSLVGMSRREILAKAAEERMRRQREESSGGGDGSGSGQGS